MTPCAHVQDGGTLICTRDAHPDNPGGHSYTSSSGSELEGGQ